MTEVYYGELRQVVIREIKEIEAAEPEVQDTAWYLLRYLWRVAEIANPPTSPRDMENAMRALLRYYVQQIEEQSELGERCRRVFETHRAARRAAER